MRTLRFFESASRTLMRLAPPCFRHDWQEELLLTVRDRCLHAHRAGGWRGLVFTGLLETSNVGESALRARLGGGPSVTGGRPAVTTTGKARTLCSSSLTTSALPCAACWPRAPR